jgi:hypothetical protein
MRKTASNATTLEFALLGLLDQRPLSGYDLRRIFATTPFTYYSDSPGAVYPALRRLEARGWIASLASAPTNARGRRALRQREVLGRAYFSSTIVPLVGGRARTNRDRPLHPISFMTRRGMPTRTRVDAPW